MDASVLPTGAPVAAVQEPKFCEDCIWFRLNKSDHPTNARAQAQFARCTRTTPSSFHLVSRQFEAADSAPFCNVERSHSCGPDAKFFEQRELTLAAE